MIRGLAVRVSNKRERMHVICVAERTSETYNWQRFTADPLRDNGKYPIVYDDDDSDCFMSDWIAQNPAHPVITYQQFVSKYAQPQLNLYL